MIEYCMLYVYACTTSNNYFSHSCGNVNPFLNQRNNGMYYNWKEYTNVYVFTDPDLILDPGILQEIIGDYSNQNINIYYNTSQNLYNNIYNNYFNQRLHINNQQSNFEIDLSYKLSSKGIGSVIYNNNDCLVVLITGPTKAQNIECSSADEAAWKQQFPQEYKNLKCFGSTWNRKAIKDLDTKIIESSGQNIKVVSKPDSIDNHMLTTYHLSKKEDEIVSIIHLQKSRDKYHNSPYASEKNALSKPLQAIMQLENHIFKKSNVEDMRTYKENHREKGYAARLTNVSRSHVYNDTGDVMLVYNHNLPDKLLLKDIVVANNKTAYCEQLSKRELNKIKRKIKTLCKLDYNLDIDQINEHLNGHAYCYGVYQKPNKDNKTFNYIVQVQRKAILPINRYLNEWRVIAPVRMDLWNKYAESYGIYEHKEFQRSDMNSFFSFIQAVSDSQTQPDWQNNRDCYVHIPFHQHFQHIFQGRDTVKFISGGSGGVDLKGIIYTEPFWLGKMQLLELNSGIRLPVTKLNKLTEFVNDIKLFGNAKYTKWLGRQKVSLDSQISLYTVLLGKILANNHAHKPKQIIRSFTDAQCTVKHEYSPNKNHDLSFFVALDNQNSQINKIQLNNSSFDDIKKALINTELIDDNDYYANRVQKCCFYWVATINASYTYYFMKYNPLICSWTNNIGAKKNMCASSRINYNTKFDTAYASYDAVYSATTNITLRNKALKHDNSYLCLSDHKQQERTDFNKDNKNYNLMFTQQYNVIKPIYSVLQGMLGFYSILLAQYNHEFATLPLKQITVAILKQIESIVQACNVACGFGVSLAGHIHILIVLLIDCFTLKYSFKLLLYTNLSNASNQMLMRKLRKF